MAKRGSPTWAEPGLLAYASRQSEDTATSARKPGLGTKNLIRTGTCTRVTAFVMGPGTVGSTLISRLGYSHDHPENSLGMLGSAKLKSEGFGAQP